MRAPVLHLSVIFILATTIYRIAEVAPTLSTSASANEAASTTLHGALPLLLALLLTVFHPGLAFGRAWSNTTPRWASQKTIPAARTDNPYRVPETQYAIRRVVPAQLSHISASTPYELYPSPGTASTAYSPRKSAHTSPAHSPRKSSHTASPAHSPRKIPERTLVDENALW